MGLNSLGRCCTPNCLVKCLKWPEDFVPFSGQLLLQFSDGSSSTNPFQRTDESTTRMLPGMFLSMWQVWKQMTGLEAVDVGSIWSLKNSNGGTFVKDFPTSLFALLLSCDDQIHFVSQYLRLNQSTSQEQHRQRQRNNPTWLPRLLITSPSAFVEL